MCACTQFAAYVAKTVVSKFYNRIWFIIIFDTTTIGSIHF